MVTVEEMKNSVGHKTRILFSSGRCEETFVESYEYEPDEDEEPFILFEYNRADYQSNIKRIEILD